MVRLPLNITSQAPGGQGGTPLNRNKLFWVGFILAASIDIINSLNYYYPSIPSILTPGNGASFWQIAQFFPNKPWNAIGWTAVSFYPFLIGLGMLMPMDFLFSLWFFYLFWKLEAVFVVANAWDADPQMPYASYQSFGAYMLWCFSSIWLAKGYLKQVILRAFGKPSRVDDRDEPLRYRTALLGIAAGMVLLTGFSMVLGLSWWMAVIFFIIYLAIALAITRMRAEMGTPIHELALGPDALMPELLSTQMQNHQALGGYTMLFWFNRSYRCQPMPIQLEAFKMAEITGAGSRQPNEMRRWFWALLIAGIVGAACGIWAILDLTYQFGAYAKASPVAMTAYSTEPWNRLSGWLQSPKPPNGTAAMAVVAGLLFAAFLQAMRVRFLWWPFNPLAYAVSTGFEINLIWMPMFIAWITKFMLLRYGGNRLYRASLPFFFGLILGQFIEGSILNIWGVATGIPTYQFFQ